MPLNSVQIVRDTAGIARRLADKMRRIHGPDRARYFEQLADAAEARAARLLALGKRGTPDDAAGLRSLDLHGLARWIGGLRARLDAGALAGIGSVELGHGTGRLPLAVLVRTLLADLDHLAQLPSDAPGRQPRLLILLGEFGRLRLQIG